MNAYKDSGLLPEGLRDDLPPQAGFEAGVTERLMAKFESYGYERVKPPLVEFEETLLTGPGAAVAAQMFRLMDPVSQRMMGVRPDMTLQVARIAATRLKHLARPARLSYAGQVLRVKGTQLRPEREIGQVGLELVGVASSDADAEVVTIAAEALAAVGVKDLSVDLVLPNLVPVIVGALGLDTALGEGVRAALDRKDAAAVEAVAGSSCSILTDLLTATGPSEPCLGRLKALDLPAPARDLVAALDRLVARIRAAQPALGITIDPCEYRGFEYHTGLSFTFFATGVRGELGRGGRYVLEPGEPATGFTLYMDSLLRALPAPTTLQRVFVPPNASRKAAAMLRAAGWRTVSGLDPAADDTAEARRLGCSHILVGEAAMPIESN
ncbi:MAG: ATP phosphoribosyltransferase regulatory subunit [Alphaproteobacteria bacterium]|nr:ATP phosphoribosyltransferase regulatory subunit [Alphaproteobacteria bacterium]